jgi:hypothetical protein
LFAGLSLVKVQNVLVMSPRADAVGGCGSKLNLWVQIGGGSAR